MGDTRRCTSCGELMAMTWLGFTAHVRTGAKECHADDERDPIYAEYGTRVGPVVGASRPDLRGPRGSYGPRSPIGKLAAESGIAYATLYHRHRRGDRGAALTRPVRRYLA